MDLVLVNDFVSGVNSGVRGALAVLNDGDDFHAEHATLSIPLFNGLQGAVAGRNAKSRYGTGKRGKNSNLELFCSASAAASAAATSSQNQRCQQQDV